MSREEMIAAIAECAARLGHPPSIPELHAAIKVSMRMVRKHFGSYGNALRAAGIEARGCGLTPLESMFKDWAGVVRLLEKVPTVGEYEGRGQYSSRPFLTRFRKWINVPRGLYQYAERTGMDADWKDVMAIIRAGYDLKIDPKPLSVPAAILLADPATEVDAMALVLPDRPMYGPPLGLPSLAHAPINEMGVVYLFGAIAVELGFMVTRIQNEFPDCEAMRKVDKDRWQRVRIEFEFESRNFLAHMHDPKQCDLVVCWRHNWPECPLHVLELKAVLQKAGSPMRDR